MTNFNRREIFYNFFAKPDLKPGTEEQSLPDRSEDDNDSSKKLHPFPEGLLAVAISRCIRVIEYG